MFAPYHKAEMSKAKILGTASSDLVPISKSLFWPDETVLAGTDLDLIQSTSMAIGVQRQTEMNPVTIVFNGISYHLSSRNFLSRVRNYKKGWKVRCGNKSHFRKKGRNHRCVKRRRIPKK